MIRMRRLGENRRDGFTSLEIILAIAILAISVAMIGEAVRVGGRNAEQAKMQASAQMLCESLIEEIEAGSLPATEVGSTPSEFDPRWLYSIAVETLDEEGLLQVTVSVEREDNSGRPPLGYSLTRWVIDPLLDEEAYLLKQLEQQQAEEEEEASSETTDL